MPKVGSSVTAGIQDSGSAPVLLPMLRLQTFLTTWWFVSVDAGIAVLTDLRAPISRITVGFDL